jgi:hypothetical protein
MWRKYPRSASGHELPIFLLGALLLGAFIPYLVQPMAAQESRGTVRGVVTDPTHAVVPGANVILRNSNTSIEGSVQTDSSGFYLFDFVIPGTYSVTVDAAGFEKFVHENIVVQTTGDVTVNADLTLGAVAQTMAVNAPVASVEFNTSNMTTTIQQSFLKDLPVLARNPFTLAMLDAGVVNQYYDMAHRLPFYMWSDGGMDIGGPTGGKNEQIIDGTRTDMTARGSYNAPMDAVQEVVVQQNIPDAEHGFSAGGAVNISMKSGTNTPHGSVYYMGRQPALNALSNRITRAPDIVKQSIYGFTVGNPIIKNKLFNFFVFEHWYATQPNTLYMTMPTDAEKGGDFSGALQNDGVSLRTIYDPTSTVFNPVTDTVTRTPISCQGRANVICPQNINPTAKLLMPYIWGPNTTPDTPDGANNLKVTYPNWTRYWNWSDRGDWNLSDKWRMFARYSKFQTRLDNANWSDNDSIAVLPAGGIMDAMNAMTDVLYMVSPRTTLDIRLGVGYTEDDYWPGTSNLSNAPCGSSPSPSTNCNLWASLWPNNNWYSPLLQPAAGIYFPNFNWSGIASGSYSAVGNGASTGLGGVWYDHLRVYEPSIILTHEMGKHHVKLGWQFRYGYTQNFYVQGPGGMSFNSIDTGNTFLSNYNPSVSGDQWASTLLGAVDSGTATINPIVDQIHEQQWGFFIQDDFRLNPRTTLNLGLRWERETGPEDNNHWLIRTLDLTQAIPQMQGFNLWTPQVMSIVNSLGPEAATIPTLVVPSFTGAAIRTSASDPRVYDSPWDVVLPRAGIAYRLNDKTAIRAGYSRFAVQEISNRNDETLNASNGYTEFTTLLSPLDGVPRSYVDNPYPASGAYPNPIQLAPGNSLGRYTDLGNPWTANGGYWDGLILKVPMNDRFNFNFQRQLPDQFRLGATMFMMFEHNAQDQSMWGGLYTQNVNMMNPLYSYQYKGLLSTSVPNPFYQAFPANIMPGVLRTEATVPLSNLLVPYPQYGTLDLEGWPGYVDHYYGLALSLTRPMSHGWTFLGTYNYSLQSHSAYYDDITTYEHDLQMFDRGYPRHNFRLSGTYELPFGSGRQYLNHVNKVVDEMVGGWSTSDIFFWMSGDLLGFPTSGIICNPTQNIPSGYWFNPNCLVNAPPYTEATSPPYYEGMRGPRYWELDSTFVKSFKIAERFGLDFRMELYNLTNKFIPGDPNVCGVTQCGSVGGLSTTEAGASWGANYGREIQYSVRFQF